MAKTVVCPKCLAEQAISRDADGKMDCVFCGEELELPEYEEGEELEPENFEDEVKNPRIEPIGEPIELNYVLNHDEVSDALFSSGKISERKIIPILETIGLSIAAVILGLPLILGQFGLVEGFKQPAFTDWLFVILMLGLIPVVWIMPNKTKKSIIKRSTTGSQLNVKIFENIATVVVNDNQDEAWDLELGKNYRLVETEIIYILVLQNGQLLVFPKRAINDEDIEKVKARIEIKEEKQIEE
ncbi:MAG: hypothetical protein IJ944_00150 [Clostridia bacterium]|nr:hypothetical protein [Clostridia bacterium]